MQIKLLNSEESYIENIFYGICLLPAANYILLELYPTGREYFERQARVILFILTEGIWLYFELFPGRLNDADYFAWYLHFTWIPNIAWKWK